MPDRDSFEAPDWVSNDSQTPPITAKQKRLLNISLFVVVPFCLWAGWFEFGRAQSGNWRAWVYTFEWTFFAGVSFYLWRRLTSGDIPRIPRPDLQALADEADGKGKQ
ncbi:MAG: hypothetical protein F2938_01385 [Actinobacteria bacterium]|uniref:Unannotated protein n=1 Tax=freshwater metagenome TaxID=449393 RepID=A0A6J7TJ70_9ZZZZ|nr:hypothetical protein [Actinomycetota bacterium]